MTSSRLKDEIAALDGAQPPEPEDFFTDYWDSCSLRKILTDPPRYELLLPTDQKVHLIVKHFLDVTAFTAAFVDVTGTFPELPVKGAAGFLRDVFKRLLDAREDVRMAEEAGDRGTLADDIRRAIGACPQTEDPVDIERGALFLRGLEPAWVSARMLLARTARSSAVKFKPADFYVALADLDVTDLGVRRRTGWKGRVWAVPFVLVPTPTCYEVPDVPALPSMPTSSASDSTLGLPASDTEKADETDGVVDFH